MADTQTQSVPMLKSMLGVLIHAQLPSMASSFPTNHVMPWLFLWFPCQSHWNWSNPKIRKSHIESDHCEIMDTRFYHPCFLTGEERTRHSKCHFQHMINRCRLRFQPQRTHYVKQNKSAVPTSDSWLKLPQILKYWIYKSQSPHEHHWRSICKDL